MAFFFFSSQMLVGNETLATWAVKCFDDLLTNSEDRLNQGSWKLVCETISESIKQIIPRDKFLKLEKQQKKRNTLATQINIKLRIKTALLMLLRDKVVESESFCTTQSLENIKIVLDLLQDSALFSRSCTETAEKREAIPKSKKKNPTSFLTSSNNT